MTTIDFVFSSFISQKDKLTESLKNNANVKRLIQIGKDNSNTETAKQSVINSVRSTSDLKKLVSETSSDFLVLITGETEFEFGAYALERFISVAESTSAGLLYSDYYDVVNNSLEAHPVIDYQKGSLRDDFNFGPLIFLKREALLNACDNIDENFNYAGLYQLRMEISRNYEIFHIPELLYSVQKEDLRASGKRIFDYVDPKNREIQIEMEKVVSSHLKKIGALIKPEFEKLNFKDHHFINEVSVIIPVRNREKTIADALESVLIQKADFDFNIIVVDNHSTDKTTEILSAFARDNENIIHMIPQRNDLGIGGCWNLAVQSDKCGRFAIQLDSDDLYKDETTLKKIVEKFYSENCAMVIGSYQMTNFNLEEIPPGLIDHKEWTAENGMNNALRINGLGAPRAFYTPVLREIKIPNTSYGEDYAVGIAISRKYKIGRLYQALYLCRRWDDNSDASLSIEAMNKHNYYKDKLRSVELAARIKLNK